MNTLVYDAVQQCILDLKGVWKREPAMMILDLAMASLRDDALALVREARQSGDADPLLYRAEVLITRALRSYAIDTLRTDLDASLNALWSLEREMWRTRDSALEAQT